MFTADDLKLHVSSSTEANASTVLSQVETLYRNYLIPSSPSYLAVESSIVAKLAEGMYVYMHVYMHVYMQWTLAYVYPTLNMCFTSAMLQATIYRAGAFERMACIIIELCVCIPSCITVAGATFESL